MLLGMQALCCCWLVTPHSAHIQWPDLRHMVLAARKAKKCTPGRCDLVKDGVSQNSAVVGLENPQPVCDGACPQKSEQRNISGSSWPPAKPLHPSRARGAGAGQGPDFRLPLVGLPVPPLVPEGAGRRSGWPAVLVTEHRGPGPPRLCLRSFLECQALRVVTRLLGHLAQCWEQSRASG